MIASIIKKNCEAIEAVLNTRISTDVPEEVIGKINELTNVLSLSATTVALAESLYNTKIGELAKEYLDSKVSATDKKMLFQGLASEEIRLYTLSERLNKACVHTLDSLRSVISFIKEDFKQSQWNNSQT